MGTGLLLTIPATVVLYAIFNLINYYIGTNQRFYIDAETIVETPNQKPKDQKEQADLQK